MAGPATREVMRREYEVFGDARFERLARISVSHLNNLRLGHVPPQAHQARRFFAAPTAESLDRAASVD